MSVGQERTRRARSPWLKKAASLIATGLLAASGIVAVNAAVAPQTASAEGTNQGSANIIEDNTFYAYMEAGDVLDTSFLVSSRGPATPSATHTLTVTDPAGAVVWTCTITATTPIGAGCTSPTLTGPAGVWTIQDDYGTGGITRVNWSIEVSSTAGTPLPGRVWAYTPYFSQDNDDVRDITVWMVNDTGYQYQVNLNDYQGFQSTIQANATGVSTTDCTPTYQSTETNATGQPIDPNLTVSCEPQFRVFFAEPAADLPATGQAASGTVTIAPPLLTAADLAVDDLAFTPATAGGAEGTFTYSITDRFSGSYELQIDTDGNGSYDDPVDRVITLGADGSGTYSYDFDGLDGQGNPIGDCLAMNARVFFPTVGEIHILQYDVEGRDGGIEVTALNGDNAGNQTIYWDDSNLANDRVNTTPQVDGTAGVNSAGGVHGWALAGNSWGNNRIIDDWTYSPINLGTGEIQIGGRCLDVEKTSDATANTRVGDTVTYTVSATNTGELDYTTELPATYTDDLTGVLDDATYNNDASADVDGTIAYTAPKLSWTGALPAGETVTMTYTVTLTATGDGAVRNVVYGDTPDITTPVCDPPDENGIDPATQIACAENEFELPRLTITKTASETELPAVGDTVTYTVTATNEGPGVFTEGAPAVVTDDLTEVIDDGTYNGDATSTVAGTLEYAAPTLSWEGALAAGQSVTIEYTVTYTGAGDQELINTACVPETDTLPGAEPCATVTVPAGLLDVSKSVDPEDGSTVTAGQQLTYTLTFDSIGTAAATVDWTDDLSAVLDDATVITAPTASSDAVSVSAITNGQFTVTGSIPAGETVTVTYTVQVLPNGERGDDVLGNFLFEDEPPTECAADDPLCTQNFVAEIIDSKSVSPDTGTTVVVGQALTYTLTFQNVGEGAGTVNRVDSLAGVLDDADVIVEPATSDPALTANRDSDTISITGTLAAGQEVTVTYTVQVRAEAARGDSVLANFLLDPGTTPPPPGTVCTPGEGEFPDCTTNPVGDIVPAKTVNPASGSKVAAGDVLTYTLSFRNAGAAASDVDYTDHMSGVLDDATFGAITQTSQGLSAVGPTNGELRIIGTVQPGQTLTVTYTVQVKPYDQQGNHQLANFLVPPGGEVPGECLPSSPLCTQNPIDPPTGLAITGGEIATWVVVAGIGLLVGGGALLFIRRRRADELAEQLIH